MGGVAVNTGRANSLENATMIKVAIDFSRVPAGRYRDDGPASGEAFREDLLRGALAGSDSVNVILDGAAGYGSSFLEEAFGGLVRKGYFTADDLSRRLKITAEGQGYKLYAVQAWRYIRSAQAQLVH